MMKLPRKSLQLVQEILTSLADNPGVSGYEHALGSSLEQIFKQYQVESSTDFIGNLYFRKKGMPYGQTVMLAAHADEIGLIVTHVDSKGFLHFAAIGGIDQRTLIHQEVLVHGRKELQGIICATSFKSAAGKEIIGLEDLVIDIGYPPEAVRALVQDGDIVTISRKSALLLGDRITGKALDDRAGIAVMAVCLQELEKLHHTHDVLAVCTVQEEVGLRGGQTSAEKTLPALAVVIDVTHGQTMDTKNQVSIQLDKGPVLTIGPNIHSLVLKGMIEAAEENRLPYQLQPVAGPTGTDARIIQLAGYGIPTALLSIPLRYMHTSVETASLKDIADCGRLLAYYIASLPEDLEELSWS